MANPKIIGAVDSAKPKIIGLADEENENPEDFIKNLPEQEGFLSKLPRNIIAGLGRLGHKTTNLPYETAKDIQNLSMPFGEIQKKYLPALQGNKKQKSYFEQAADKFNQEHNIPEEMKNPNWGFNIENIPHQSEYNYAQSLGQQGEGTLMDRLIQGGIENAPEILSGGALLRGGIRRLKGTHQLDKLEKFIKEKGLSEFNYPEEMIQEAKKFLPPTKATKEMISQVNEGNYKPAFNMQSQVGHHQRKLLKSPLASENSIMAPLAGELKQNMVSHLEKVLRNANYGEEADLLKTGINNYRQYKKVIDVAMPIIKYLGIPTTILTGLGFAYKKGKKALID